MGRIVAPYGVRGWVKIQPFTEALDSMFDYDQWWMKDDSGWLAADVEEAKIHGKTIVAKLADCEDRESAFALKGVEIGVSRDDMPEAGENEYYWSDLIGLRVRNLQQVDLGEIKDVFATGANDVLVVKAERERLIPFTDPVVMEVDIASGHMLVDWDADF